MPPSADQALNIPCTSINNSWWIRDLIKGSLQRSIFAPADLSQGSQAPTGVGISPNMHQRDHTLALVFFAKLAKSRSVAI